MTPSKPSAEYDARLRASERFLRWFLVGVLIVFGLPMLMAVFYLDNRLESFEESFRYRPPEGAGEPDSGATEDDAGAAEDDAAPVRGQLVYVPAYSHVYHRAGEPVLLTITLSVRNTDPDLPITIKSARYFDTEGREVRSFLKKPLKLGPLASAELLVDRDDTTGGSGANFLIDWAAGGAVTDPIIEAVMIDTASGQGISFVSEGRPIRDWAVDAADDSETSAGE